MLALLPQLFLTGLTIGSIYALVAIGFVIIYNITGILNFAQGEFPMIGAMLCAALLAAHVPLVSAAIAAIAATCLLGALAERVAIEPALGSHPLTLVIITFGVSMAFRGLALMVWGADPYALPEFTPGAPLTVLTGVLGRQAMWTIGLSVLVVTALFVLFARTLPGAAARACADNPFASRLVGVSPRRMGLGLGLKGFVAAVIGGLTNAPAAVLGGYLVGMIESLAAGYLTPGYGSAITFAVLLVVLSLQREGLWHVRRRQV